MQDPRLAPSNTKLVTFQYHHPIMNHGKDITSHYRQVTELSDNEGYLLTISHTPPNLNFVRQHYMVGQDFMGGWNMRFLPCTHHHHPNFDGLFIIIERHIPRKEHLKTI